MNYNYLCCLDFETTGVNPTECEIIEIGAQIINPFNLSIVSEFNTYVQPSEIDKVSDEIYRLTHTTKEILQKAPLTELAWSQFVSWVRKYNTDKKGTFSPYNAPIAVGYGITNYDMIIVNRYCKQYGPYDSKRQQQSLFSQVYQFDVLQHMWYWFERNSELPKLKLTSVMEYLGFAKAELEQAHGALADVKATTQIMIKLFKLSRYLTTPDEETGVAMLNMKGTFSNND